MKPGLKYELIDELFGNFSQNFEPLFLDADNGYRADSGFKADLIANLYKRSFIKGMDIVRIGENIDELYLIAGGGIDVLYADSSLTEEKRVFMHVLALPTFSYFGDYQIMLNVKSMFVFMSNEGEDTTTMCISRKKLTTLLEQNPRVFEHW